jgi:hypothetical protein
VQRQARQNSHTRAGLFARLGRFVVTHPWRIIGVWVVAAILLTVVVSPNGLVDPASVKSNNQENFLPAEDEELDGAELKGDGKGQQYNTPQKLIGIAGSDIVIVGRGILKAGDPAYEADRYRSAAWKAYTERVR